MRNYLLSFTAVFLFQSFLYSQSITPFVINTTGGSFKSYYKNFYVDWSVGEMTLVNTMKGGHHNKLLVLTNGLLQPSDPGKKYHHDHHRDDKNFYFTEAEIKVFPNPAVSYVQIDFTLPETGTASLSLYNAEGRLVYIKERTLGIKNRIERIPMSGYNQGSYLLYVRMVSSDGSLQKSGSFKIVKTN